MMTKRECAIITAYTGAAMLTGTDLRYLYEYVSELLGHSVQTIELTTLADEIKEKAKPDFLKLCQLVSCTSTEEYDLETVNVGELLLPRVQMSVSEYSEYKNRLPAKLAEAIGREMLSQGLIDITETRTNTIEEGAYFETMNASARVARKMTAKVVMPR